jgi:hypothetical protein
VFLPIFAENVLHFMLISNKKKPGHPAPVTASFQSETQNFRDFHIFLDPDDKLSVKTTLRADDSDLM